MAVSGRAVAARRSDHEPPEKWPSASGTIWSFESEQAEVPVWNGAPHCKEGPYAIEQDRVTPSSSPAHL